MAVSRFFLETIVFSHQNALGENMPLHSLRQYLFGHAGLQTKHRIKGIDLEEITVFPDGRTRPLVTQLPKISAALEASYGKFFFSRNSGWQLRQRRRQIINQPMNPIPRWSVGIIGNDRKTLCLGWDAGPFDRRRHIGSAASKIRRNPIPLPEGRASDLDLSDIIFRLPENRQSRP